MEYIIGPVLTLLLAMKFTDYKQKNIESKVTAVQEQMALVEKTMDQRETELPKKLVATMVPLAKAVKVLNQQVGIQ
jgi:predicted lipid carrier protein YhbT